MFIRRTHDSKDIADFVKAAGLAVMEAISLFGSREEWTGRSGGYFCVSEPERGFPILVTPVGIIPVEKGEKYLSFCQEKAKRLASHQDHRSSWESRNPVADQWGGAVCVSSVETLIFSISGFPELGDEAIMLATGGMIFNATDHRNVFDRLDNIAKRSNNPYWFTALRHLLFPDR